MGIILTGKQEQEANEKPPEPGLHPIGTSGWVSDIQAVGRIICSDQNVRVGPPCSTRKHRQNQETRRVERSWIPEAIRHTSRRVRQTAGARKDNEWRQIEPGEAFLSIMARTGERFAQRPDRRSQECQILQ